MRNRYEASFLNTPDKTVYSNPMGVQMKGVDYSGSTTVEAIREAHDINMKALETTTGGPGTAGYALVPVWVDPRVTDLTRKYTPLVELVPRVTNMGMYADYNQITGKGGATTVAENASLTETDTSYDRQSTEIKFIVAVGAVTGPAIAAIPSYTLGGLNPAGGATGAFNDANATNAKQMEVLVKTREIREEEERLIISGDSGTTATEFDGIIQIMGSTNAVDKATGALALADIDTAIQNAYDDSGRPNLAVCSSAVYTDLLGLLTAKIGYLQPVQQVFWGFSTIVLNTMVGQVPVIPSQFLSNASGSKSMYFLDMSVVEMRVLQDISYQELARTNDAERFFLKVYEALIIKAPQFCASIINIG